MAGILEDAEQNLTPRMRLLHERVWQEWKQVEIDVTAAGMSGGAGGATDEQFAGDRHAGGCDAAARDP
jgi:hypothetical protein